ncbi:MAG: hypothetical protein GVY36_04605 [Verrucomicrobia bacterium]|jgi:hypothetical protein|nr:hypothetical protein [Verrucomicrobiota bacterium]
MKLPLIKHIDNFVEANDADFIEEAAMVLEHISEFSQLSDEELDVIGELISNFYGALEVDKMKREGVSQKEALSTFMGRVMGSIDK